MLFTAIDLVDNLKNQASSIQLHLVVDALTHALLAKHPKERYIIRPDAKFVFIPMSYLPIWLQVIEKQILFTLLAKVVHLPNLIKTRRPMNKCFFSESTKLFL